jgi:hypothetical protein
VTDEEVRAALRSLVDGTVPDHAAVVDDATAALTDVEAAAAFVEGGGMARLDAAVRAADRAGDPEIARRGRRALAALRRCRRAAADHFRPARGTVLGADRQPSER